MIDYSPPARLKNETIVRWNGQIKTPIVQTG